MLPFKGFGLYPISNSKHKLVRVQDNIICDVTRHDMVRVINEHLDAKKEPEVKRAFMVGSSNYLNNQKYDFLPIIEKVKRHDTKNKAYVYYQDVAVEVTSIATASF